MTDTACVEGGGSSDDPMNLVSLAEEELSQVGAIL